MTEKYITSEDFFFIYMEKVLSICTRTMLDSLAGMWSKVGGTASLEHSKPEIIYHSLRDCSRPQLPMQRNVVLQ